MTLFVETLWSRNRTKLGDIPVLLGSLARDGQREGAPHDIAQWSDWLDAVLGVRPDLGEVRAARRQMQEEHHEFQRALEIVPLERRQAELEDLRSRASEHSWHRVGNLSVTVLDAFEAMHAFLLAYWNRGGQQSSDLKNILDGLEQMDPGNMAVGWSDWLGAIRAAE